MQNTIWHSTYLVSEVRVTTIIISLIQDFSVLVIQLCLTHCDPMDCSPPGSSVSMGFSRQEYWGGLPFPSSGDLPNPGIELGLHHCRQVLYSLSNQGGLFRTSHFIKVIHMSFNYHTVVWARYYLISISLETELRFREFIRG